MKNVQQAIKRLLKAREQNERIGIWGDYDPDGICSATMLYENLLKIGFNKNNLYIVLPNLRQYGRSFNQFHLDYLKQKKVSLIVGVDFGTADFRGTDKAIAMGFNVIFLDHHQPLNGTVKAILVNPWQKGDPYPHKNWSAVGVVYKFLEDLYRHIKKDRKILEKSLDLFTLGMLADRTIKDGANLPYLKQGLKTINQKKRLGVKIIFKAVGAKKADFSVIEQDWVDYLGSLEGNNEENNLFRLLTTDREETARGLAEDIYKKYKTFRAIVKKSVRLGIKEFKKRPGLKMIFWEQNLKMVGATSSVAEKLNDYFKVPVFICEKIDHYYRCSIRAGHIKNVNVVEVLKSCKDLFMNFGGHPRAAGFKTSAENFPKVKQAIEKYYE